MPRIGCVSCRSACWTNDGVRFKLSFTAGEKKKHVCPHVFSAASCRFACCPHAGTFTFESASQAPHEYKFRISGCTLRGPTIGAKWFCGVFPRPYFLSGSQVAPLSKNCPEGVHWGSLQGMKSGVGFCPNGCTLGASSRVYTGTCVCFCDFGTLYPQCTPSVRESSSPMYTTSGGFCSRFFWSHNVRSQAHCLPRLRRRAFLERT